MNILITGATGFIGGYVVDYALAQGLQVIVTVRPSSDKKYLTDSRISFVTLDFSDREKLTSQIQDITQTYGNIDLVIHNAGITKTTNYKDYDRINYQYSVYLIEALTNTNQKVKKFTLTSSMAACAPGSDITHKPIQIEDIDKPVSAYGRSKKKIEQYLEKKMPFPYIILRPPPVFGPRDIDMFTIFELINKKLEIYVGGKVQLLSFVYVKDLARGMVTATLSEIENKKYFLSDNKYYDSTFFNKKIKDYLKTNTYKINLPLFIIYTIAFFSEIYSKLTGNLSQLNLEKINEIKCLNWTCDSQNFYEDMRISPQYSLEQGIAETIDWYKQENWLN